MSRRFNDTLQQQNPIRALGASAHKLLEAHTECKIIQLQLGNPRFHEDPLIAASMKHAIDNRPPGLGYDSHFGSDDARSDMASAIQRMYQTAENHFEVSYDNVVLTNGATLGVNAVIEASKFSSVDPDGVILLSSPGYPPYESIARMHGVNFQYYFLNQESGYFLTYQSLKSAIQSAGPSKVRLIIYNYPHNPTGATPNRSQAENMAEAINRINREYPEIFFLEESLYYGTIAANCPFWAPYSFLSGEARDVTIVVGSGSKIGLAGPRAGFIFSSNKNLASMCANYVSLAVAGSGYIPHAGYLSILRMMDLHQGQVVQEKENPRLYISDFFQKRLAFMSEAFKSLSVELGMGENDIVAQTPRGGMYLWVDLGGVFKGKTIPREILSRFPEGKKCFENSSDIQFALLWMFDLRSNPVIIAPGDLFGEKDSWKARVSCASSNFEELQLAIDSIGGLARRICLKNR